MAKFNEVNNYTDAPSVAQLCAFNIQEGEDFAALPLLNLVNVGVEKLKSYTKDGERGLTLKKAGAYLGFRLISYTFIPLALNALSALICGILSILSLPLQCCEKGQQLNRWFWVHFQGSLGFTLQSLFDLTCDFRMVTGSCCCDPESTYLLV